MRKKKKSADAPLIFTVAILLVGGLFYAVSIASEPLHKAIQDLLGSTRPKKDVKDVKTPETPDLVPHEWQNITMNGGG